MIEKHALFQTYYYAHLIGLDRNGRDKYLGHPYYDDCVEFCEKYDQESFDPAFESLPLEFFAPMVQRVFGGKPALAGSVDA
jgi:predicted HD phosphohydrolase